MGETVAWCIYSSYPRAWGQVPPLLPFKACLCAWEAVDGHPSPWLPATHVGGLKAFPVVGFTMLQLPLLQVYKE